MRATRQACRALAGVHLVMAKVSAKESPSLHDTDNGMGFQLVLFSVLVLTKYLADSGLSENDLGLYCVWVHSSTQQ